jgi:hypothetical protein
MNKELIKECCGKPESECTCHCVKCGKEVDEDNSRLVIIVKDGLVSNIEGRMCFDCYYKLRGK